VETQIIHYPEREKYVVGQGKYIQAGYATTGGSHAYVQPGAATTTTTTYQTYQTGPTTTNYTYQAGGSQYGAGSAGTNLSAAGTGLAYQTYMSTVPTQAAYQLANSATQYGSTQQQSQGPEFILSNQPGTINSSSQVKNTSYATNI
jgi:hypothetical protein